ncbi:hypothetical protein CAUPRSCDRAFT_12439 [Caulochytrium protostelioides]|uniref:Uncharacterized protein n=1 Tax=Caulochytrium protostelioides TaxID=1555241 RepID=A0A4P9WRL3_9FUNG|nr:hypothetical protein CAUPRSCDRAFT_12439 [Caulochytrium protostelioides]
MAALAPVAPSHPEASSKPHSISLTDHPDSSLSRTPTAPVATEDEMATPRGGLTDHSSPEMPLIRSQSNHEYHTAPDEGATHHASLSEMPLRRSAGESQDTRLQESDVFAPVLPHQTAELPRPDVINSLPLSSASNPLTTVGLPTSGRAANNETIAETSVSGPALGPPSDNEVDLKQGRADDSTTPSMSSSPPQEQPAVDTEVPRAPTELTSDKSLVSEVDEAGQHPPPVETDDTSVRGEVSRPDMQDTWIADALASEVSADPPVHGDGKARLSDSTALEESSVPAREARRSPEAELPVDMSPAVAATTLNQNGKRSGSTISSEALDVFKKSRVTSEKSSRRTAHLGGGGI